MSVSSSPSNKGSSGSRSGAMTLEGIRSKHHHGHASRKGRDWVVVGGKDKFAATPTYLRFGDKSYDVADEDPKYMVRGITLPEDAAQVTDAQLEMEDGSKIPVVINIRDEQ